MAACENEKRERTRQLHGQKELWLSCIRDKKVSHNLFMVVCYKNQGFELANDENV